MVPVECDCKFLFIFGRCSVLMVSVVDSELSGLGSKSGRGYCVVFLGKTSYSGSQCRSPPRSIIGQKILLGILKQLESNL